MTSLRALATPSLLALCLLAARCHCPGGDSPDASHDAPGEGAPLSDTPPKTPAGGASDPDDVDITTIYGHPEQLVDCEQRKAGCVALVIDLRPAQVKAAFPTLADSLNKMGCDPVRVASFEFSDGDASAQANAAQWAQVEKSIQDHLDDIANQGHGRDLVIEAVSAHGGERNASSSLGGLVSPEACGTWSPLASSGSSWLLFRRKLWKQVDERARHHVCSHVVYDDSCYSGLTPWAMDELENVPGDSPTCADGDKGQVSCPRHAAYWADLAFGSGKAAVGCATNGPAKEAFADAAAEEAKLHPGKSGSGSFVGSVVKKMHAEMQKPGSEISFYADGGSRETNVKSHPHGGY